MILGGLLLLAAIARGLIALGEWLFERDGPEADDDAPPPAGGSPAWLKRYRKAEGEQDG